MATVVRLVPMALTYQRLQHKCWVIMQVLGSLIVREYIMAFVNRSVQSQWLESEWFTVDRSHQPWSTWENNHSLACNFWRAVQEATQPPAVQLQVGLCFLWSAQQVFGWQGAAVCGVRLMDPKQLLLILNFIAQIPFPPAEQALDAAPDHEYKWVTWELTNMFLEAVWINNQNTLVDLPREHFLELRLRFAQDRGNWPEPWKIVACVPRALMWPSFKYITNSSTDFAWNCMDCPGSLQSKSQSSTNCWIPCNDLCSASLSQRVFLWKWHVRVCWRSCIFLWWGEKHSEQGTSVCGSSMFELGVPATCHKMYITRQYLPQRFRKWELRQHMVILIRSQGTTLRSWWNPEGGQHKSVVLSNIFVMRMMYMFLGFCSAKR